MLYYFIAVIICYIGIAASQTIYGIYHFNEEQRRQIITIHNELRAREPASNMQELVWDQRLADLAYGHAKKCDAWHRSAYERHGHGYSYIGENIWWSNEAYLRSNLQSAMLDFFNERPYYDYSTNKCMKDAQCGHYTQYVWSETCAVGCAAVHCSGIKNGRGINQGHIIICNYGEGGNQFGKRPYLLGSRCSNCQCGGECTSEGLCPPCCTGIRYPQQGNFMHLPPPRAQASRKLWQNKIGVQQKQKNYQRKGIGKLYNYECRDLEPYCENWAQNVGCYSKHRNFMMKRCPKTCNTCHPFISAVNQVRSCTDNNPNCDSWARYGQCHGSREAYMAENCRLSCALCSPSSRHKYKYQSNNLNDTFI
ncbi:Cysteine-rich secretory family protein [Acanthocheilonema viteae]